jgi:hypothetical protein
MSLRCTVLPLLSAIALLPAPVLAQPAPASSIIRVQEQKAVSSVANFLPENTSGVVLIKTDATLWQALSRFGIFPEKMSFPGWLYSTNVNYETDVRPWIGDQIGFAILPATKDPKQDRFVTIAPVQNESGVNRFLEKIKAAQKTPPVTKQYKGITILEWKPEKKQPVQIPPAPKTGPSKAKPKPKATPTPSTTVPPTSVLLPTGFAIAILPNHVVTSTSAAPIQQLVDAQADGKSLTNNPLFQRTLQNPKYQKSIFAGYGNYLEIIKALDTFNQAQLDKLAPNAPKPPRIDYEKFDVLGSYYDAIDGYVWADTTGLRFNAGIHFKRSVPESLIESLKTKNEILNRLPAVSYAVSNGQNLALFWQTFMLGFQTEPMVKKQIDQFRTFSKSAIGVDDRDLIPWMDKEIATFIYPTRQGFLPALIPNFDVGFGLMVQTSDRTAAEAALKKIDQQFQKNKITPSFSQGKTFTNFSVPMFNGKPQTAFSHGWVSPDTLLILAGGGSPSEFSPQPIQTLPKSVNFQLAIAALKDADGTSPASNLGYFYVNGGAVGSLINTALLPIFFGQAGMNSPFADSFKTVIGSVRSISGSSGVTTDKVQTDAYLGLAPRTIPLKPKK